MTSLCFWAPPSDRGEEKVWILDAAEATVRFQRHIDTAGRSTLFFAIATESVTDPSQTPMVEMVREQDLDPFSALMYSSNDICV